MVRLLWVVAILIGTSILVLGCVRYLDEPPIEFEQFVDSLPTPAAATQVADHLNRMPAPREICTSFSYVRLYGTNRAYPEVLAEYRQALKDAGHRFTEESRVVGLTSFVVGEHGRVAMGATSVDDKVSARWFGQQTLQDAQTCYATLFVLSVEHSYGSCKPRAR